jgi:MFS family permease
MVAFFGVPLIVIINGLSNLYSAISEIFIRVPKTLRQGEAVTVKGVLSDMRSAIKTIFSEPCLKIFIPCAIILNFLSAGSYSLLLPFCMQKGFSVDMYGYLMSITTVASLICVVLLGIIKLKPMVRFWVMAISFTSSVLFMVFAFLTENFVTMCILGFLGAFMNCAGNAVFNASLMLALPEDNRGAILGFVQSACVGGSALSAVLYGVLGDIFPLYIVFAIGSAISLLPMIYLCFHPRVKKFILSN